MSDRIDFYEIRIGDEGDWDHVALVKGKEDAEKLKEVLEEAFPDNTYFIEHVEIVAETHLSMEYY
jgi:hypothetical protein